MFDQVDATLSERRRLEEDLATALDKQQYRKAAELQEALRKLEEA